MIERQTHRYIDRYSKINTLETGRKRNSHCTYIRNRASPEMCSFYSCKVNIFQMVLFQYRSRQIFTCSNGHQNPVSFTRMEGCSQRNRNITLQIFSNSTSHLKTTNKFHNLHRDCKIIYLIIFCSLTLPGRT